MKKWIITLALLGFIMGGCKNQNNNNKTVKDEKKNEGHYRNFDDLLETKSTAKVDTSEFRKVMSTLLPTKRIIELFGSGYQVFYLGLTIDIEGKVFATVAPDAGWWVTGLGDVERLLFKEDLEIAKNYAIIPNSDGDSKAIDLKSVFYFFNSRVQKAFTASPGMLNGKKVRSVKIFQIDITVDNANNIIRPWSIKEMDIAKFRPQIITNLGREYYMGYFPSVLKEDFKFISDRIEFPVEAVKKGVRGRVLVKLYFEGDGEYAGYQLLKGLGYGCDEAVIDAIKTMKPKCYSSGQRSTLIVPFNFGPSDKTPVDVSVKSLEYNPKAPHNKLKMVLVNNIKQTQLSKTKFSIHVFMDENLVLSDINVSLDWDPKQAMSYWFGGNKLKTGEHNYVISIDPENVLNDVNRDNNIVRGKLIIK